MKKKSLNIFTLIKKVKNKIKLYVFDYDGTIFNIKDKKFDHQKAFLLIKKVILRKKTCLILTARCASFIDLHLKNLKNIYKKNKNINPIFIGGGNGSILYKYSNKGLIKIYNNGLLFEEVKKIMKLGKKIYENYGISIVDLNTLGIKIHKTFLRKKWQKLIPNNFVKENKLYEGICFSEEAKIAFVLPKNKKTHKKLIESFNKRIAENLSNKYSAVKGDDVFMQINKAFKIDSKLYAMQTIIKKLDLFNDQVMVFGNTPDGNDKGILIDSQLPFVFSRLNVKDIHSLVIKSLQ